MCSGGIFYSTLTAPRLSIPRTFTDRNPPGRRVHSHLFFHPQSPQQSQCVTKCLQVGNGIEVWGRSRIENGKFSVEMREGKGWGSPETHRESDAKMTHPDLRLDLKGQQELREQS